MVGVLHVERPAGLRHGSERALGPRGPHPGEARVGRGALCWRGPPSPSGRRHRAAEMPQHVVDRRDVTARQRLRQRLVPGHGCRGSRGVVPSIHGRSRRRQIPWTGRTFDQRPVMAVGASQPIHGAIVEDRRRGGVSIGLGHLRGDVGDATGKIGRATPQCWRMKRARRELSRSLLSISTLAAIAGSACGTAWRRSWSLPFSSQSVAAASAASGMAREASSHRRTIRCAPSRRQFTSMTPLSRPTPRPTGPPPP